LKTSHQLPPLLFCLLLLVSFGGCRDSKKAEETNEAADASSVAQYRQDMFVYAIDGFNRLEDYNSRAAMDELSERFNPETVSKPDKPGHPVDPLTAIWPQPEMFHTVVDRLNQWLREEPALPDWKLDPMTAGLPKPLLEMPQVKNLDKMEFSSFDGLALQEAAWLRDVSLWAKGDAQDEVDRVTAIFDWTVRNIQLDFDDQRRIPQFPRETLLLGHGTPTERAWLFILLLRQLGIEAAFLAVDEGNGDRGEGIGNDKQELGASAPSKKPGKVSGKDPAKAEKKKPEERPSALRVWCIGVLIEGQVYLFDPLLGLPIPAADGVKLGENGQLTIRPATLAEAAADPKILARLDYDESRPYGVKASDLKHVAALLEASPPYLSKAMKAIESQLSGSRKMVLTTSPSTVAEHWKAAHVENATLWPQPFITLYGRSHCNWRVMQAWLSEVLPLYMIYEEKQESRTKKTSMYPKGMEVDEPERPTKSGAVVNAAPLYKARVLYLKGKFTGDDGAIHYFQAARPSNDLLRNSSEEVFWKQLKLIAKIDATYWSGLLSYEQGNYRAAIDYFLRRTLEQYPNCFWTNGARFNLARSYEADNKRRQAITFYGGNTESPGAAGDLLRAKWLRELDDKAKHE
jgi:hypothetical protein